MADTTPATTSSDSQRSPTSSSDSTASSDQPAEFTTAPSYTTESTPSGLRSVEESFVFVPQNSAARTEETSSTATSSVQLERRPSIATSIPVERAETIKTIAEAARQEKLLLNEKRRREEEAKELQVVLPPKKTPAARAPLGRRPYVSEISKDTGRVSKKKVRRYPFSHRSKCVVNLLPLLYKAEKASQRV